jgi:hypothetical protein
VTRADEKRPEEKTMHIKLSRVGGTILALVAGLAATAGTAVAGERAHHDDSHGTTLEPGAPLPSIGQSWLADFGQKTALGPFAAKITFTSATEATFVVTKGGLAGSTDTVQYTSTRVRPGLFVVRWHEPKSGADVTQVEDYARHTVVSSIVAGSVTAELDGTFTQVR